MHKIRNDLWVKILTDSSLSYLDFYNCQRVPGLNLIVNRRLFVVKYIYAKYGLKCDDHDNVTVVDIERVLVSSFDKFREFNELWHHKYDPNKWYACRYEVLRKYCGDLVSSCSDLKYWENFIIAQNHGCYIQRQYFIYFMVPHLSTKKLKQIKAVSCNGISWGLEERTSLDNYGEKLQSQIVEYDLTQPNAIWSLLRENETRFIEFFQDDKVLTLIPNLTRFVTQHTKTFLKLSPTCQCQIIKSLSSEILAELVALIPDQNFFHEHYYMGSLPMEFCLQNYQLFTHVEIQFNLFVIAHQNSNYELMSSIFSCVPTHNYTIFKSKLQTLHTLPIPWIINHCPSLFETESFRIKALEYALGHDSYEYLLVLQEEGYNIVQLLFRLMLKKPSASISHLLFLLDS